MAEQIWLDPVAVSDATREALDITAWVKTDGADWGDSQISAYMSDGAVGSAVVDFRVPNRTIALPLALRTIGSTTFTDIRSRIQQKAALFQRDGGWLLRQIGAASPYYADVVSATLHLGGDWLQAFRDVDINAVLTLECLPEFYGDEITLDSVSSTGSLATVLQEDGSDAIIAGAHPGRCRIRVTDTSGNDQTGLIWGYRSQHYDDASTARLIYEAEALETLDATVGTAFAGASGGTVLRHPGLPANAWCPVMSTDPGGTASLTHQGTYRVWGRCRSTSGSAAPQVRLVWGVGDVTHPITNDPVALAGTANLYNLDFGSIRLDAPPVGSMRWRGVIQAKASAQGDQIDIDQLYFQPLDESAGKLTAVQSDSPLGISSNNWGTTATNETADGTKDWTFTLGAPNPIGGYAFQAPGYGGATTKLAKVEGFALTVPVSATISGIKVGALVLGTYATTHRVSLVKGGTTLATNRAVGGSRWPGSPAWWYWGGETDMWGTAWTPAEVNAATFGAALAANIPDGGAARFNQMKIFVYYTLSGGFTTTPDAVVHASQTAEVRTDGMFREDSTGSVYGQIAETIGDMPRIPASGMEETPVELFVKPSRGDFDGRPDSGLDGFITQVIYRPVYPFVS